MPCTSYEGAQETHAPAVAEPHGAVSVEDWVALHPGGGVAVAAVEEALLRVALLVAVAVAEHVPAALAAPRRHLNIETHLTFKLIICIYYYLVHAG